MRPRSDATATTNTLLVPNIYCHQFIVCVLPVCHQCAVCVPSESRLCAVCVLPVCHLCAICVPLVCRQSAACVPAVCCLCAGTCDSPAGRQTVPFRQEVVVVSFTSSEAEAVTVTCGSVVPPAREGGSTGPDLHMSPTECWHNRRDTPRSHDPPADLTHLNYRQADL